MAAVKLREQAIELFNVCLKSVTPHSMVMNALKLKGNVLTVENQNYILNNNVYIVAFGKAVIGMVKTAEEILGEHLVKGIASVPFGIQSTFKALGKWDFLPSVTSKVKLMEGGAKNIPDENSLAASEAINELLKKTTPDDIVLVLISGGGSALLPSPTPPITLEDLQEVTKLLSCRGASIQELNTIRKHLEYLKGGGLAKAAYPSQVITLILSDVVDNDLNFIASGPTSQDFTTPQQCFDLLENYNTLTLVPQSVLTVLNQRAGFNEFKKSLDFEQQISKSPASFHCNNVQNYIIGSNVLALKAGLKYAETLGFGSYLLSSSVIGGAEERGEMFAMLINFVCRTMLKKNQPDYQLSTTELNLIKKGLTKQQLNEIKKFATDNDQCNKPICILAAGETTVTVEGSGSGGRCQHMVLSTSINMDKLLDADVLEKYAVIFLSADTDGQDGPNDASGAICDQTLARHARKINIDPVFYLKKNDSYNFFSSIEAGRYHIKTGLTGTNVMGIHILIISPISSSFD